MGTSFSEDNLLEQRLINDIRFDVKKHRVDMNEKLITFKKSKLHKKYQELLEDDFQRHTNPYLIAQERIITPTRCERNAYDEIHRQKLLLLQKELDSLMSEQEIEYSSTNTTENQDDASDENSVLKESLSFIFFEDENLSQAEKDLEFQKLLCNENLKDENKDLHQVVLCKNNFVCIYTNK